METGYYYSRDDKQGDDPFIANSQWRYLAGYQYQLWEDFTVGAQYYAESMDNYWQYRDTLPGDAPVQDQFREVISTRLTQFLGYQTWKLALFTAYSPTDKDSFLQPEISYKLTDSLTIFGGGNVFGGEKEDTFFEQFDKSDNLFVGGRFDF